MLNTANITMIKSTISKRGQKMYFYYSDGASRWIRIGKAVAEDLIATEQAEDVTGLDLPIM